jgi:hypothetical protein
MTGAESYIVGYSYDFNDRLLKTTKTVGSTEEITNYQYDPNGNTISTMDEISEPSSSTEALSLSGAGWELSEYNGFKQLVKTVKDDLVVVAYLYKPDGLRFTNTTNGATATHVWDGQNMVAELDGSTVAALYVRGMNLLYAQKAGIPTYYGYNAHGDVIQLTDASGNVTRNYNYDAFGVEQGLPRYTGNSFDSSSGLYTDDFAYYFHNAAKYYTNRPDTGECVEVLELMQAPAQAFAQWLWIGLSTGATYVMEFDYWGGAAGSEFVFGLYAGNTGV